MLPQAILKSMQLTADSVRVPAPSNPKELNHRVQHASPVATVMVTSVLVALLVYAMISIIAGKAGLIAQQSLRKQLHAMEERLNILKAQNASLSEELESLVRDPEKIAREARKMGYVAPDEYIVRIVTPQSPVVDLGSMEMIRDTLVLRAQESPGISDILIKKIAIGTAVFVFLIGILLSLFRLTIQKPGTSLRGSNKATQLTPQ